MESLKQLYEEQRFRPRKAAGQNFLADPRVLDRLEALVQAPPGDALLEIGGGTGQLTARLLRKGLPLTVVESDRRLFALLSRKFGKTPNLALLLADARKLDVPSLAPPPPGKLVVAGNLPYSLTSPLLVRLLEGGGGRLRRIYVMVQREVGDRLAAEAGTRAYGALTLLVRYRAGEVRRLLDVPPEAFRPRPKVHSAFLLLEPREASLLPPAEERRFFTVARAVFQSRRKTLENSLKRAGFSKERIGRALEVLGFEGRVRGETLGLEEFLALARALG